jgi:hypothetical protein
VIEQDFDTLIVCHYLALGADATAFDAFDPDRSGRPRLVVSASAVCAAIGEALQAFTPEECANYLKNSGYRT